MHVFAEIPLLSKLLGECEGFRTSGKGVLGDLVGERQRSCIPPMAKHRLSNHDKIPVELRDQNEPFLADVVIVQIKGRYGFRDNQ